MYYNPELNDRKRRRAALLKTAAVVGFLVLALLGPDILPEALLDLFRDAPAVEAGPAQAAA